MPPSFLPRAEKDADHPSVPSSTTRRMTRRVSNTLTAINRLFVVQAATSPQASRQTSHVTSSDRQPNPSIRTLPPPKAETIPEHLYHQGFVAGKHSDIKVNAFGRQYRLHRLILDRAPFFASALSGSWLEANADEISVHPEEIDAAITPNSFEMALHWIYGCHEPMGEVEDPIGLFATGCWLEMRDLVDFSTNALFRQATPATLAPLIRLVTGSYYGAAGDKILASAKSMLYRDGWQMPLRGWDGIPGHIVRDIIGGDAFFVDGEWDRWVLAGRLLNRRLTAQAAKLHLFEPGDGKRVLSPPNLAHLMTVRCNTSYRKICVESEPIEKLDKWTCLYAHAEVEPILSLLDEGIYYMHLDFTELQYIQQAKDIIGIPVVQETVLNTALWQQTEIRHAVKYASKKNVELGLSRVSEGVSGDRVDRHAFRNDENPLLPGGAKMRKFWIPSADAIRVIGSDDKPIPVTSSNPFNQQPRIHVSPASQYKHAQHAQHEESQVKLMQHTHLPPFRFSAEFSFDPQTFKTGQRKHSRTVWYAGSLWNVYLVKMASPHGGQLGVYLHRAEALETGGTMAGEADMRLTPAFQQLMLLRFARSLYNGQHVRRNCQVSSDPNVANAGEGGEGINVSAHPVRISSRAITVRKLLNPSLYGLNPVGDILASASTFDITENSENQEDLASSTASASKVPGLLSIPSYLDMRPAIQAYFKIYHPSHGGRMLSVYESVPDTFHHSSSWGWRSSSLMLDKGLLGNEVRHTLADESGASGVEQAENVEVPGGTGDLKLRFTVVIGNV